MRSLIIHLLASAMLAGAVPLKAQSLGKIKSRKIKEVLVVTVEKDNKGKEKTTRIRSTFDKKGNLLEEAVLRSDGSVKSRTTYEYNKHGHEAARRRYNSKYELIHEKLTEYHPVFSKPVKMEYREDGKTYKIRLFEYDNDGDRVMETTRDGEEKVIRKRSYYYDAKGMLTKKVETRGNGAITQVDYQYQY